MSLKMRILLTGIGLLLLFTTCTKKSITIEMYEAGCKELVLSKSNYKLLSNCYTSGQKQASYSALISVAHNDKVNCLDFISVIATFKDNNGNILTGTYKANYQLNDPEVSYSSSEFKIRFDWTIDPIYVDRFEYVTIEIFSQNELNAQSNRLYFTIPISCTQTSSPIIGSFPYDIVTSETSSTSTVNISFYDFGTDDGDIIDVYLNNVLVISNLTLTKSKQSFDLQLNTGDNYLIVKALNEGRIPPNTCAINVNSGRRIELTPGLSKGQAINIKF